MFIISDKPRSEIGIKMTTSTIEGQVVHEYGIIYKQTYHDITISAEVPSISTDFNYVSKLAKIIFKNSVDPCSLQDIIEDYIVDCTDHEYTDTHDFDIKEHFQEDYVVV